MDYGRMGIGNNPQGAYFNKSTFEVDNTDYEPPSHSKYDQQNLSY